MKKTPVALFIILAASILAVVPITRAEPSVSTKKRAQIVALMQDDNASRYTFREMMKDPDKKRYMARALAHDAEARNWFNAEVGNDGPHQERNPSQHPELFQLKKP